MPVVFVALDESARIVAWNEEAERVTGYSRAEIVAAADPWALLHPDLAELARMRAITHRDGDLHDLECTLRHRDGGERTIVWWSTARRHPLEWCADWLLGMDVSAARVTQRELTRSNARMQALLAGVPDVMFRVDRWGRYLDAHAPAGSRPDDGPALVGRTIQDHLPREDADGMLAAIARALDSGAVEIFEHSSPLACGLHAFEARIVRSGADEVTVISRDVTELRTTQQQLLIAERRASVGTLAAGVAHEINNPLAFLSANVDFVAERLRSARAAAGSGAGSAPPSTAQHDELLAALADAQEGARRVRDIVRDLGTFSRVDPQPEPMELQPVLEYCIQMAANQICRRATLVRCFEPTPTVCASAGPLSEVFLQLLSNAAQAIPEGAAERNSIRVSTRCGGDGRAVVEIADSGVGIAPEHLTRVFDPFFSTRPIGAGTGLGLAICHGIVTSLGGEIGVESRPGEGSTFRVVLPAALPAPAPGLPLAGPPARPTRRRVLIVDDEPLVARAIERTLGGEHAVVVEDDAQAALARFESGEQFDLVLCDLATAQTDTVDFHAELARRWPSQLPLVAYMTGGAFTPRAREFLDRVPNPRIDKPLRREALLALLARVGVS